MSEDKKSERIFIRVSPEEKKSIETKAEQANMTVSQYVLKATENKKIVVSENIPKLFVEITRIGVNINQIAHVANAQKYVKMSAIYETQKLLREVQESMTKILQELYDKEDLSVESLDKRMVEMQNEFRDLKKLIIERTGNNGNS